MKLTDILGASARQRAISLIEGVLYLVIALAVIVGGIVFFQQSQLSNRVTDTARAAVGISSQLRALYQNQNVFGDNVDLTAAAVKSGAVPSNFVGGEAGESIVHPFNGGGVAITGLGRGFVMSYSGISSPACQRMAIMDETGAGPMGIGIAGVTIGAAGEIDIMDGPSMTAPVTPEAVSESCETGTEMAVFYSASTGGGFDEMMAGLSGPGPAGTGPGAATRDNPWGYPFPTTNLVWECGTRPGRGYTAEEMEEYTSCRYQWSLAEYGNKGGTLAEVCGTASRPQPYHFPDGDYSSYERTLFTFDALDTWPNCMVSYQGRAAYE